MIFSVPLLLRQLTLAAGLFGRLILGPGGFMPGGLMAGLISGFMIGFISGFSGIYFVSCHNPLYT